MKNPILHLLKTTIAFAIASALPSLSGSSATWVTWDPSAGGNGHSYLAVPGYPGLTWNVASQLAQAQGGYLATINSAAENDFVFGLVNSPLFFSAYNGSGPALGGYNAGTPSNPAWSWVSGEPWTFSNWLPGTPDYADFGPGPEDRLEYFSSIGGTPANTWNDLHHDDGNIGGYVIEVVPEPHSLSLLAVVAIALVAHIRTRKTRNHQDSTKFVILEPRSFRY